MVKSEPKKKPQFGGFFQKFFRKPEKNQKEQRLTVQRSIPYLEMGRDGICRVEEHLYSKTVRFYDINYQLAQNEDKNTIFESWCDFLNYFDASIRFQLSFINHKSDMSEYNKVIQIEPQHDAFDDVRMEYAQMLRQQLRSVYKELHADHETGAADNKLRLNTEHRKSVRCSACFVVRGFQRGFPFGTRLCLQSVVCYTLCRRCRENTVAAGEGKGI